MSISNTEKAVKDIRRKTQQVGPKLLTLERLKKGYFYFGTFESPVHITTISTGCAAHPATPVPTSPLWLLGIMAGLLSLVGIRKLRKA